MSHAMTSHAVIIKRSDGFYKCICNICGKKCFQKDALEEHMATHIAMKCCKCGICGKIWNTSSEYRSHILASHATKHKGKSGTVFECNICGRKLSQRYGLEAHLATHTKRERTFRCLTCGKGFFKRKELTVHESVHTDEYKYNCNICGNTFLHSKSFYHHMKKHSANDKQYRCNNSRKSSENIEQLEAHSLRRTVRQNDECINGSNNRKKETVGCKNTWNNLKSLQIESNTRHVQKSTTDMIAEEMNQLHTSVFIESDATEKLGNLSSFDTEFSMTSHLQKPSHDGKNANPCKCGICGEILISAMQLRSHVMTRHATIKDKKGDFCKRSCNICGKTFTRFYGAEKHLALHTKRERSFKCKMCDKGFFTKLELMIHEKTHSRVFEYACDICMKGFHDMRSYRNHIANHLSEE
ncbi:Zinc finger protein 836 [Mizuhopecten yessoensis]|uniref:Zinc finger protein 836 n=2 Tax=Mizuhopecten yessoensis TaxID=6573 RepID=A0A210PZG8_MIZYE|nr:Zinc finger protein 836 [Mizuhopecten yessoensis]